MTSFDLPKVCVVSGRTDNIVWKPMEFQWVPPWAAVFAIAPAIYLIVYFVIRRRAKGELPFTEDAWAAWKKSQRVAALAILGGVMVIVGAIVALGNDLPALGLLLLVAAIVLIVVGVRRPLKKGPVCTKIDKGFIELKVPSVEAASVIASHLAGGAARRLAQ